MARVAVCRASSLVAGDSEAWSKKGFCSNSVSERSSASERAANSSIDPAAVQPFTGTLHNADFGLQCRRCFTFSHRHAASRPAPAIRDHKQRVVVTAHRNDAEHDR